MNHLNESEIGLARFIQKVSKLITILLLRLCDAKS